MFQKWPDKNFSLVNFVVSHDGHFGLEAGVPPRPPMVYSHSDTALPTSDATENLFMKSRTALICGHCTYLWALHLFVDTGCTHS